jgi:hypothetical protein
MIYLFQEVFSLIIIRSLVSVKNRCLWQIKGILLQCVDLTTATMGQKKLHWLTIFGHHQRNLATIELPFLTGNIASKALVRVELGVFDAEMITC